MSPVPPVLVIGQSHAEALSAALHGIEEPDVEVANLNARDRELKVAEKIRLEGYLPSGRKRKLVASMIGGNFYNTFGLIENSVRFDFAVPGETDFVLEADRQLISYALMKHYFSDVMNRGFLESIRFLRDHYDPCRFVHVCSPPPIADNEHIVAHPGGVFRDKVHLGVTPSRLRRKLYDLHTLVISDFCQREGIELLLPPPQAVTDDGFLAQRYWKQDPTHANTAYGKLVLNQLRGKLETC
jgi:hypothetical protein